MSTANPERANARDDAFALPNKGTFIILGATSAIARAFTRKAASEGYTLVLGGRDTEDLAALAQDAQLRGAPLVQVLPFDASDPAAINDLLTVAKTVPLSLNLFLAFGQMPEEALMRVDPALCASMIATNYTGAVLAVNALLPMFEAQQSGRIIILGSVAGDRGRKKNFIYGSSKAGLHAYAQGLAAHLSAYKVPVLLVKPGVIDTAMTWGLQNPPVPIGTPEGLAEACWKRSAKGGVLYYPWFWFGIMTLIRHLPRFIFNRLNF